MERIAGKIALSMVLFLTSTLLWSGGADWSDAFAEAKTRAAAEKKCVYLMISSAHCSWCRKMEGTLADDAVKVRLDSLCIAIKSRRDIDPYPQQLQAKRVPMHYFLAPDASVLVKIPGYWKPEDFLDILTDVERKLK